MVGTTNEENVKNASAEAQRPLRLLTVPIVGKAISPSGFPSAAKMRTFEATSSR